MKLANVSFSNSRSANAGQSHARQSGTSTSRFWIPVAFVLCWSSGFVVPRAFAPYCEPLTFTAMRNAAAMAVLVGGAMLLRRPWPGSLRDLIGLLWSGALLQGAFLATIYWSIYHGLPTGIAALIGGLQPAITAIFAAAMLGEAVTRLQWAGIALGFAGVALVISLKLDNAQSHLALGLTLLATFGVACGSYASIYQKRFEQSGDLLTRTATLFVGALIPPLAGAFLFEQRVAVWSPTLILVYAWSVLALAICATMAFLNLIQQGQAARAASLIYLVPPVAAFMAYMGFGEQIGPTQFAGFAVAAIGVALVQRKQA